MIKMTNEELIKRLGELIKLDVDATLAYAQALDKIDVTTVRTRLATFRQDHEQHVSDLSSLIRFFGGEPPDTTPDARGYAIQGFTALRSVSGTKGALEAMRANERLVNRIYSEALHPAMPADAKAIVDRNQKDEQRHLQFIEQALVDRVWELGGAKKKP